jgi:hypothetical protein
LGEKSDGIIRFAITFPSDNYQPSAIPQGTDRFSIFVQQVDYPDVNPKHVEVSGEPGETKEVKIEIGAGNYKVAVFATKALIMPSVNSILAAGISNQLEVIPNQVTEASVVLEEIIWFDLVCPSEVLKDTVYTFSGSVNRVFIESCIGNTFICAQVYDEQGLEIPNGLVCYQFPGIKKFVEKFCAEEVNLRMPDVDATGTVKIYFTFGNAPFGYNLAAEYFVSPFMEATLVKESETGIIVIIQ